MKKNYILFVNILIIILIQTIIPFKIFSTNSLSIQNNWWIDDQIISEFPKISIDKNDNADLSTFHYYSHGRPGQLLIDGKWLNQNDLAVYFSTFIAKKGITHLNIYGCEFAKGKKGKNALTYLQFSLGIDVSASNNITGKNGDWELEVGNHNSVLQLTNFDGNLQWTIADTCATCDFDGDSILNNKDLDADNDGIQNYIESPNCFLSVDALSYGDRRNLLQVSTSRSLSAGSSMTNAFDGLDATNLGGAAVTTYVSVANIAGLEIFTVIFPTPVSLNQINLVWNRGASMLSSTSTIKVQGSADGSSWTDVSTALAYVFSGRNSNYVFSNTSFYQYYRVVGVTGSITGSNELKEVLFSFNEQGFNVKINPCTSDFDGDGFPNWMDTDADQDGCLDYREGSNHFASALGLPVGTSIYSSNYGIPIAAGNGQDVENSQNASVVNCCISDPLKIGLYCDYDGDNVLNYKDLDDDNDGITDIAEGVTPTYGSSWKSIMYDEAIRTYTSCGFPLSTDEITVPFPRTDMYGLPWFPSNQLTNTTSYSVPDNPVISYPTSSYVVPSSGLADYVVMDMYVNFSCHTNVKISLANDNYCQKNWLYISPTGSPYDAVLTDETFNGASSSLYPAFSPEGIVFLRLYSAEDAAVSGWKLQFTSDQQTTPMTIDNVNPSCNLLSITSTDTDSDGIPNYLDLDSDGDGCTDAIEGGASFTSTALYDSALPGGNNGSTYKGSTSIEVTQNLGNDVDAYGIPMNATSTGQSIGTSEDVNVQDINCLPLPIKLSLFVAKNIDCKVNLLSWITASEVNSERFEIERSINGYDFVSIGNIEAAHNSITNRAYLFKDYSSKSAYYRLKMVNIDKSFEYSDIIFLNPCIDKVFKIGALSPNPTSEIVNLELKTENQREVTVYIFNALGQLMLALPKQHLNIGQNNIQIDVNELPNSTYFLKVEADNIPYFMTRFIKEQ